MHQVSQSDLFQFRRGDHSWQFGRSVAEAIGAVNASLGLFCPATGRIYALAFDNTWFTNFAADSHGAFEFQFDLAWSPSEDEPADDATWAESLMSDAQVVIHLDLKPHPIFMERLHRP
jgi:hypothetical protein